MSRRERERTLLDIVERQPVGTQASLVRALHERGIEVTQATVSRDIRRLGLVKLPAAEGGYRYASAAAARPAPVAQAALRDALEEFATGVLPGEALLAVKTLSGCANAVAVAIDEAALPGVVATLAGDDTILILAETDADRARLLERLRALI